VLEEPPDRVVIILIAESTVPLLPTVVSRCQLVRFSLIPAPAIERALVERHGVPKGRARFVAALSGGELGRAVRWVTSEETQQRRERILDLLERLEGADPLDRLDAAEEFSKDKDDLPELLEIALYWYRDILVWQQTGEDDRLINLDRRDRIAALAPTLSPALHVVLSEMRRQGGLVVSVPQFQALAFVERHPRVSLVGVAEDLGATAPTASTIVDRLVRRGLVVRVPDPDEGRRVVLSLTPA